jgi:hypothetical protein
MNYIFRGEIAKVPARRTKYNPVYNIFIGYHQHPWIKSVFSQTEKLITLAFCGSAK